MNDSKKNELMASLYRQVFYSKMLNIECEFFMKYPVQSGIKQALKRMRDCYVNNLTTIRGYMPNTQHLFAKHVEVSDEKIRAIANIVEKLSVMDEADVLRIETDFEVISVNY